MRSRKVFVCAIALFMVLGVLIVNVPTLLADVEPNNNFPQANPLAPMTPVMGSVDAVDVDDYYELATTGPDQTVSTTLYIAGTVNLYMYDGTQTEVASNLSVTDPMGLLHYTFATAQTVFLRIEFVGGVGNYQLIYMLLDDIIQPEITHTPVTTAIEGQEINITAEVTDNVGVNEVRLNYTGVDMVEHNEPMTAYQDNYTFIIPGQGSAGSVEYFIWANDTSDPSIENQTSNYTITITEDTEPPTIDHTPVTSAEADAAIPIIANVTDNVGLNEVKLNYTDVAGTSHNETMTVVEGNYTFDIPAQTSGGTVTYFIWANDTNGNVAQTTAQDIAVSTDVTPPTISHTAVKETDVDESIEITATITDDVGVESATLYYRKTGDTTFTSVTMIVAGDTYSGTIPASAVTEDGVEYYITATDGFNEATFPATDPTTSPQEITIAEEEEFPWLWIIIGLIIIIVIIVIIVVAAKKKGPAMMEEEEVEPMEEELPEMPSEEDELP
jgi:hypothetical protein